MPSSFSSYNRTRHPWRIGARWTASRNRRFKLRLLAPEGSNTPNSLVLLDIHGRTPLGDVVRIRGDAPDPSCVFAVARVWWTSRTNLAEAGVSSFVFEIVETDGRTHLMCSAQIEAGDRRTVVQVPVDEGGLVLHRDADAQRSWSSAATALVAATLRFAATRDLDQLERDVAALRTTHLAMYFT